MRTKKKHKQRNVMMGYSIFNFHEGSNKGFEGKTWINGKSKGGGRTPWFF